MNIKQQILDYLGDKDLTENNVEIVADPYNEDVWAARVKAGSNYWPQFLVHPDGDIEEVEFTAWPPTVRH